MSGGGSEGPSALVDFVAGTVGGIASLLAGHPFDTIKTRLQAQPIAALPSGSAPAFSPALAGGPAIPSSSSTPLLSGAKASPRYRSATDAFRIIVREEKLIGLYKGVTSPMLGVAVMNASVFGVYGLALRMQQREGQEAGAPTPLSHIFIAGAASGIVSALITAPIDLIKIREQLDAGKGARRTGTWAVVKDIWRRGGLRGLYRGLGCTCIRDIGYGPYFLSYEMLNRFLLARHDHHGPTPPSLSAAELAVSGGLAGVIAWVSTFWADVVKTKVQATEAVPGQRSPFLAAARATYAEAGLGGFFTGVRPTILRALPVNAALFITFEATKDALTSWGW